MTRTRRYTRVLPVVWLSGWAWLNDVVSRRKGRKAGGLTNRRAARLLTAALVLVVSPFVALSAAPVSAAPTAPQTSAQSAALLPGGGWNLVNRATGLCLDSNAAGDVYALTCNGGLFQVWVAPSASSLILWDEATYRCLDSDAEGRVYTLPCNGGPFQDWYEDFNHCDTVNGCAIRNAATLLYLDSNAAGQVYTHIGNGGLFQRWRSE